MAKKKQDLVGEVAERYAVGCDLGGTSVKLALVNPFGQVEGDATAFGAVPGGTDIKIEQL